MKVFTMICALLCSTFAAFTQVDSTSIKAQKLLDDDLNAGKYIGIVAGFSTDGEIVWQGTAGNSDEETKTPFQTNTKNRTASITKPMTAVAVMQLVEQGKIDLDAPVQTYIPDFPKKKEGTITVRHLLQHSSGIDAYKNKKENNNCKEYATMAAAVDLFKDRDLLFAPGEKFAYTSYGYTVLGLVVEQVSGMSFVDYMRINIFEKAGMENSGIEKFGKVYENKATLYHRNHKGKMKTDIETNLSDRIPAGGVYTTATDVLKFGDAVMNNTLLKQETVDEMFKDSGLKKEGNPYGMGWHYYGTNDKYGSIYGHSGGQLGVSGMFFILPDLNTSIIVLSNTSGAVQEVSTIAVYLFNLAGAAAIE